MSTEQTAKQNTDRELWRERPDDYYANSLHVTKDGDIGINVAGRVIVLPLWRWHELAMNEFGSSMFGPAKQPTSSSSEGASLVAAQTDPNQIAVKLAELMAAHRDGMDGSDCSDINDPGSCDKCLTLDAAIKTLSASDPLAGAILDPNDCPMILCPYEERAKALEQRLAEVTRHLTEAQDNYPHGWDTAALHQAKKLEAAEATIATVKKLSAKWREKGAQTDTFHATMGIGWKVCADDLDAALAAPAAGTPEEKG